MQSGSITPILRIFDVELAQSFYLDFLGFQLDWQHQFEDNFPLYLQISKDDCIIISLSILEMQVRIAQFVFIGNIFMSYIVNSVKKIINFLNLRLKKQIGKHLNSASPILFPTELSFGQMLNPHTVIQFHPS